MSNLELKYEEDESIYVCQLMKGSIRSLGLLLLNPFLLESKKCYIIIPL